MTVLPSCRTTYLIVDEEVEKENNWPDASGEAPLGKMFILYDALSQQQLKMYEKWIVYVGEV